MKTLNSLNWRHRDDLPKDDTLLVFSTGKQTINQGVFYRDPRGNYVDCLFGGIVDWGLAIGWMDAEDFPFATEEDFE